jgi:hypothetical protein
MARLETDAIAQVGDVHALNESDFTGFRAALAAGQDLWVLLRADPGLTQSLVPKGGEYFVRDYDAHHKGSGHFLVIAGYRTAPDGTYYLLHNSWGLEFGNKGYAFIHENTLRKNIDLAYTVDAAPQKGAIVPQRRTGHTSCKDPLAPDSVTLQCVPVCPDGSPRHNGACPVSGQCPAGRVNLSGACVVAAPVAHGTSSGIAYTCAPGGCIYKMGRGQAGCTDASCEVSCPAPTYRLSKSSAYYSCVE